MRLARLLITPELATDMLKAFRGRKLVYTVIENSLPDDAVVERIYPDHDKGCLVMVLESDTFDDVPEGDATPVLPAPLLSIDAA